MNLIIKPTLIGALLLSFAAVACAQTNGLVGQWTPVNANSASLTRVVVSQHKDSCSVEAWGDCKPTDCDWGKVELKLLGDFVGDKLPRYGFAHWDAGFADNYMTLRMENSVLVAEVFTFFKDGSQRSNYRMTYSFRKQ
jgi:hypothetical protein